MSSKLDPSSLKPTATSSKSNQASRSYATPHSPVNQNISQLLSNLQSNLDPNADDSRPSKRQRNIILTPDQFDQLLRNHLLAQPRPYPPLRPQH
jgi:hypothetical protein